MLASVWLALAVTAAAASGVAEGLLRCSEGSDSSARLVCYDRLARDVASGTARSGTSAADASAGQYFGVEAAQARLHQVDAIESHIPGIFDGWTSGDTIRLANGQRWRIADNSKGVVYGVDLKVRVRRGSLGAFYLEFAESNQSPRVVRVE